MGDPQQAGDHSSPQPVESNGSIVADKRLALIGAVVAAVSTLAAAMSLKDLFQSDPFLALAVFTVIASFLTFVVALISGTPSSKLWPVVAFSVTLLLAGVAAGLVSMLYGPRQIQLDIGFSRAIKGADAPRLIGRKEVLNWDSATPILLERGPLTLDLEAVEKYYEEEEQAAASRCAQYLVPLVGAGPGEPARF